MNPHTMKLQDLDTDEQVLAELGRRLKTRRVRARLSQEALADRALLSRTTVSKIENGHVTQTPELIRLLRELGYLEALDRAIADESESPLAIARAQRSNNRKPKTPSRVRTSRPKQQGKNTTVTWPEDNTDE